MTTNKTEEFKKTQEIILNKALIFLSGKPRTVVETTRRLNFYLRKRGKLNSTQKDEIVDLTIHKLKDLQLLDDKSYVNQFIKEKIKSTKPESRLKMRTFLMGKGLERDLIDAELSKISPESEKPKIKQIAEKKLKTLKNLSKPQKKQKMIKFITNKGFSYEETRSVVDSLLDVK